MPTAAEIKLEIWNDALRELGHRRLTDTGEPVEAAREFTASWSKTVLECLARGSWNFATETIEAEADTGVTPEFGYSKVFAKPSDWLRTVAVSDDENFARPLLHYYDDINFWSSEANPIYVRYVSQDTGMGLDLTRWTPAFSTYVGLELAWRNWKLAQNVDMRGVLEGYRDKARRVALNQDAMAEPNPKFPPPSGWTMARGGITNRERGSRSRLIG